MPIKTIATPPILEYGENWQSAKIGQMKLQDWLDQQEPKMSATAFAKRVGLDVSTITRVMNGERRPEWPTLDKILAATDGAVTPNDFIPETDDAIEQRAVN